MLLLILYTLIILSINACLKRHLQKKLGQERKVFIAYPATLKYLDENGRENVVRNEDFKRMKSEMEKNKR